MEESDPQQLWRRIGAGDRRAFTALYERYEDDVIRFCRALLHDGDDAREAANSTWASVWRARSAAQREVELRPWLFRIARNEAVDILRRRRPHEPLDATLAGLADPVADAELHERLAVLRADLLALSHHQRTALVLRELSGLSHGEIGEVLGVSSGAAKQTIYEARRALLDAEGGRSLSCDLIRRDLAGGDRRVLRGRRLRAHLRSCAACREVAASAERGERGLRALLPGPVAALLARLGPQAALGGGTAAAPLLAKATAAAVVVAVGTSVAASSPHAASQRPAAAVIHHVARAIPAPRTEPPRPAAPQASSTHRHARRVRAEGPAAKGDGAAAHPAAASDTTNNASPAKAVPPGQARQGATISPSGVAPGQVRKAQRSATPPGQAKRQAAAAPAVPPGQAKRQAAAAPAAPAVPPGQAKRQASAPPAATASPAAPAVPPGQAKQQAAAPPAASAPPGQAKKGG